MSRILTKCNLTEEEQARIFLEFEDYLTGEEEETLSRKFTQYLFYETYGRKDFRECVCTRCGVFEVHKEEQPGFFKEHHGDSAYCPECGEPVELFSMGRMRTGSSLKEWQRAVFVRVSKDGGLLLSAGYGTKNYTPYELRPAVEWFEKRRIYLAPGKRMQWERELRNCWNEFYGASEGWKVSRVVSEPFNPGMGAYYGRSDNDGSYWLLGWSNAERSKLRWCQLEEWYKEAGEGWISEENAKVRQACKYLAKYTEFPQIEMAVKIGMTKAVSELVLEGRKNHRELNWNARTVQGFLRMSKADARTFLQSEADIDELRSCKVALGTGTVKSVMEYMQLCGELGNVKNVTKAAGIAKRIGIDLKTAVKYLVRQREAFTQRVPDQNYTLLVCWTDYLDAAEKLEYDMTEPTVIMPKNLPERHDAATQMVKLQASAEKRKAYKKRYERLRDMYEFRLGDYCVIVPESGEAIIAEGKTLQHCVGGYANRHLEGKLDILFIRHWRRPERSFMTVEMAARKAKTDSVAMIQIHGYKNERYKNAISPEDRIGWFLDAWTDWLRQGSKRDGKGVPVLQIKKEKTA